MDGELRSIDVEYLHEYEGNPRRGDVAAIAASLDANGQFAPIVVRAEGMVVLSGNHTLAAARSLGWDQVDAWVIDVDEDAARRIVLAANRTASLGSYDTGALAALLEAADGELEGTGYSEDDLGDLLATLEEGDVESGGRRGGKPIASPTGQRMLVLDFTVDGYLWAQDGFREVCEREGVDTNVAAVVKLLQRELGHDAAVLPEGLL